jgi:hypothetical protein
VSEEIIKGNVLENTPYSLIVVDKEVKFQEQKKSRTKKGDK